MKNFHYSKWSVHALHFRQLLIMKLIFLLVAVLSLSAHANTTAQTVNISKKSASLIEVFREIKKQTGYSIICESTILKNAKPIDLALKNTALKTALDIALAPNNLEYVIDKKSIVVREKTKANIANKVFEESLPVVVQQNITGIVSDEEGPLPGVTVSIKGTSKVTSTDANGKYSLSLSSTDATLVFSILGYIKQEVQINKRNEVNVKLIAEENEMSEVVVVGYGSIVKKDLTSAVTSLKEKDLVAGAVNPIMAIQGKVAGLSVSSTNGSDPNSGLSLQLRGVNSVNAGMGPLVVIDGVSGGDINSVAKEDIESINILKDGSAASIYGTRASGGVILITTKQAKAGNTNINLTSELFTETVRRKPQSLTREEFLSIPANSDQDKGGNTNWYDEVLNKNPFSQRYAININGGSEKALIYTTGVIRDAQGMAIESKRREYSARINSIFKFWDDKAELRNNFSYNHVDAVFSDPSIFNMALLLNPTEKLYNPDDITGYNIIKGGWDAFNPVAEVRLQKNKNQFKYLLASTTLKINLTQDLNTSAMLGVKNNTEHPILFRSAQHRISRSGGPDGLAQQEYRRNLDKTFEWTFNYNKTIENHNINAVAGYSYQTFNGQYFNAQNADFSVDGVEEHDLGNGTFLSDGIAQMSSAKNPTVKLAAFFGRINYSLNNKYIATASLRREGSSKFAPGKRWGNFAGISAAWRISEESFLKDYSFINDLKLRAGYGETGNADFDAITAYKVYQSDTWWIYNEEWIRTYGIRHNQNADLRWEVKKETNIGLDFTLFNQKLSGRFDVYRRKINDMIYSVNVSQPPAIYNQTLVNLGDMENKGFEVELNYNAINKENFTYSTGIVAASNKGKLTNLNGSNTASDRMTFPTPGHPGSAVRLMPGEDLGQYFIWKSAGFTDEGEWLIYNKDNQVIPATDKTLADKRFVGNAIPKLTLSWNNNFTYKSFDASLYMRSWVGYDVFNMIDMYYGLNTVKGQNLISSALDKNKHITEEKQLTDYWLEKGNFLKVDALSFGYTFKPNLIKNIKSLRAYLTGRDLLVLTKYSGLDPEVNVNGLDPGFETREVYPKTRTFMFGVQIGF